MTAINAVDMHVHHELQMSTADLGWLARGALAAAATDEAYGVRYHAHVVADGTSLDVAATDGRRIHHMHVDLQSEVPPVNVVVPREAMTWAAKNARLFKAKKDTLIEPVALLIISEPISTDSPLGGWVSVIYREWDGEDAPSARFDAPLVRETYPDTIRAVNGVRGAADGEPSPIPLGLITAADTLTLPYMTTPTIRYTAGEKDAPGPAIIDFWEGSNLRATAVIAPSSDGGENQ